MGAFCFTPAGGDAYFPVEWYAKYRQRNKHRFIYRVGEEKTMSKVFLKLSGICKSFAGVQALKDIDMAILTLQFLSSGFNMMRADGYFKTFIWGAVLIAAMIHEYGFTRQEAYLLLGQVLESRCSVYVSPMYTVVCKVKRSFLHPQE